MILHTSDGIEVDDDKFRSFAIAKIIILHENEFENILDEMVQKEIKRLREARIICGTG